MFFVFQFGMRKRITCGIRHDPRGTRPVAQLHVIQNITEKAGIYNRIIKCKIIFACGFKILQLIQFSFFRFRVGTALPDGTSQPTPGRQVNTTKEVHTKMIQDCYQEIELRRKKETAEYEY